MPQGNCLACQSIGLGSRAQHRGEVDGPRGPGGPLTAVAARSATAEVRLAFDQGVDRSRQGVGVVEVRGVEAWAEAQPTERS
ncbi:hypothetical protein [Mycobacteroides chelonae]|uniref:hypothetical protein n=1 Tax=Mycobacteroides chelonae TaxID=1774 RepID=UPI000A6EC29F|nr:hypothetical protein [Mycobacteroides chelonae]MBF9319821.1 hypothetical protein [Mycobacteroides chelonae]